MPSARRLRGTELQQLILTLRALGVECPDSSPQLGSDVGALTTLLQRIGEVRASLATGTGHLVECERAVRYHLKVITGTADCSEPERVSALPVPPAVLNGDPEIVGDVNLLFDDVPLTDTWVLSAMERIVRELIQSTGAVSPDRFEVVQSALDDKKEEDRVLLEWTLPRSPTGQDLQALSNIAEETYPVRVRGRSGRSRAWWLVGQVRGLDGQAERNRFGVGLSPDPYFDRDTRGLIVSRVFRGPSEYKYLREQYPADWLTRSSRTPRQPSFRVEIREGGKEGKLGLPLLIRLIVQTAYYLATGDLIDRRTLCVAVYQRLSRWGTERVTRDALFGLDDVLESIEHHLLLPLELSDDARRLGLRAASCLLVGTQGVGKSLVARYLRSRATNALVTQVDPIRLAADLQSQKGSGLLFLVDEISRQTGLPFILTINDLDLFCGADKADLTQKLLELFEVVRQRGFYILGATNYPDRIDPRLFEPGRLAKVIYVGIPDRMTRTAILWAKLRERPYLGDDLEALVEELTERTEGWTGRFLDELVQESCRTGLRRQAGREPGSELVLTRDDCTAAHSVTKAGIDLEKIRRMDVEVKKFLRRHPEIGFHH